jgi:hypothetical protein
MKLALLSALTPAILTAAAAAQTAFTYQGRLKDGNQVVTGTYDLRFSLFSSESGATQLSTTQCIDDVTVTDGLFTTTIDFGQQFNTPANRFLEIEARADTGLSCGNSSGFVVLGPRQLLTATPRAIHARSAFSLASPDGSPADALIVNTEGRIGIGTLAPTEPVHIANDLPVLLLQDTGSASTQTGYLDFRTNTGVETAWVGFGTAGSPHFSIVNIRGNISLFNQNGEWFTLVPSGNIGIGTNTPQARLDVRGSVRLGTTGELFAPGGTENLRIIRGTVNSGGTRIAGNGFTSSHPGVGDYTIVFDTPFSNRPTVTATCEFVGGSARIAHTDVIANGQFNIVVTFDNGSLVNSEFSFIAIGPR